MISREPVDQICPAHFMAVERSTEQTGIKSSHFTTQYCSQCLFDRAYSTSWCLGWSSLTEERQVSLSSSQHYHVSHLNVIIRELSNIEIDEDVEEAARDLWVYFERLYCMKWTESWWWNTILQCKINIFWFQDLVLDFKCTKFVTGSLSSEIKYLLLLVCVYQGFKV